jgi:hypothetical protein
VPRIALKDGNYIDGFSKIYRIYFDGITPRRSFRNISRHCTNRIRPGGLTRRCPRKHSSSAFIAPQIVQMSVVGTGQRAFWIEDLKVKNSSRFTFPPGPLMFIPFGLRTEEASSLPATRRGVPLFLESRSLAQLNLNSCSRSRKKISMATTYLLTAST